MVDVSHQLKEIVPLFLSDRLDHWEPIKQFEFSDPIFLTNPTQVSQITEPLSPGIHLSISKIPPRFLFFG